MCCDFFVEFWDCIQVVYFYFLLVADKIFAFSFDDVLGLCWILDKLVHAVKTF